jgi:ankyrin repeat protein
MKINKENMFHYIQNNENELVKEYLKNDINVKDTEDRTAFINAVFYNNLTLLDWLIKNNANINLMDKNGYTALHFASQQGNLECVKILLKNNCNVNSLDKDGNTPAWVAIMNWRGGRNYDVLKELYKNNADLEIKNKAGNSASKIIPKEIMEKLKS